MKEDVDDGPFWAWWEGKTYLPNGAVIRTANVRCDSCNAPSHGFALCAGCRELVAEHQRGEHAHADPNCPECLLIAE